MDALDILNRIADLMQKSVDSQTEKAKSGFTESLGIDKDMYDKVKGLVDQFEDSKDAIESYKAQIKKCDEQINKFDKSISELQDNLKKAKRQQDKDKIQKKIDEKRNDKQDAEARRKKLKDNLNSEELLRNRAERQFKRKTGKNIAQGVAASKNLRQATQAIKGGKIATAVNSIKGLKMNPWMMLAEQAIKAVEWGIGKATEYTKLNYENLLRALNSSTAVSLNQMKANLASWQDSVTGAYEAQDLAISSQETMMEAQNATELANLKMANTWTNWIPIWGQINKYQETSLELEQKLAQTRLENAHKIISQVNQFTKRSDDYIKKQEKSMRGFQVGRGLSTTQYQVFEKYMLNQGEDFAKLGKTIEDALKMQNAVTEQTGRTVNYSAYDNLQGLAVGRLVGDENLTNFQAQMQIFNHSVSDSADIMYDMYKDVNKMGLSQKKVTKDVLANLKLANKYNFKNGTQGFIELAKWAENARFNLNSLGGIIEKIQSGTFEDVITQSARLQNLGGNFAMRADPLGMFYEGLSDPDALAKRIHGMFKGMGVVNPDTGETTFNGNETLLVRSAANALGMDIGDVRDMIREENKKNIVKRQMSGSTLTPEQQDALANKAQRDATTGEWYVNTIGGERMNVSDVKESDLSSILSNDNDEKAIQYAQNTMSFVEKIEATTKQIDAKLGMLTFSNFAQMSKEQMENSLNAFGKYSADIQEAIEANRYDATAEQKAMLDGLKGINTQYSNATNEVTSHKDEIKQKQKEAEQKLNAIKVAEDKTSGRWNNVEQAYQEGKNAGYFENFEKGQDMQTARAKYYSALGDEKFKKGDYLGGAWNKLGAFSEQTIGRAGQAIGNLFGASSSGVDDFLHDGITTPNNQPMIIAANKISEVHDGTASIAKSDPKDSAIFAKTGGPFDTLFNGIFDKINDMYGMFADGMEHNNELSTPYLLPVPTVHDNVLPLPTNTDRNYLAKSQYSSNSQNSQWGNSGKGQFDVNVRGEINLKANGQTIDILRQLQEDPLLVRAITQMISESIASQKNGGRAPYGGYRW